MKNDFPEGTDVRKQSASEHFAKSKPERKLTQMDSKLRRAELADLETVCRILRQAMLFQRKQGFEQWPDNYPDQQEIRAEIEAGLGWIFEWNNQTAGFVIINEQEPVYGQISTWKQPDHWCVLHRVALGAACQNQSLSRPLFADIFQHCLGQGYLAVRIDTKKENGRMQHILGREGFRFAGEAYYEKPVGARLCYEKVLKNRS